MRGAVLIAALSGCTFAHGYVHRYDAKPDAVKLSPKMAKLDREQRSAHWAPIADMGAAVAGLGVHPFMQALGSPNETLNVAGLGVFAVGLASFVVGEALWGGK